MLENDRFLHSHGQMAVRPDSKSGVRQPQAHDMSLFFAQNIAYFGPVAVPLTPLWGSFPGPTFLLPLVSRI